MRYRIHGTCPNGDEDYLDIEAETIDELRDNAKQETNTRNLSDCWSECLDAED